MKNRYKKECRYSNAGKVSYKDMSGSYYKYFTLVHLESIPSPTHLINQDFTFASMAEQRLMDVYSMVAIT